MHTFIAIMTYIRMASLVYITALAPSTDGHSALGGPTLWAMREFDLLKHIFRANPRLGRRVLIPPGDDMGMVQLDGRNVLAAVDQLIDGVHFDLAVTSIDLIGRKAITRNLSDIAAMAARPVASLVSAALPPDFGQDRANALFDAMRTTAEHYDCPLIGGDIAIHRDAAHPLVCSVTVLAEPAGRPIRRDGAKPGDIVCVTGKLGGSLEHGGLGRHLTFEPRVREALAIAETLGERLHSMIDISDGLGRDAAHIAEMSGVRIRIDGARIPCNPPLGCDWRRALSDGEDYELCFTAAPGGSVPGTIAGLSITQVGEVLERDLHDPRWVVVQIDNQSISGEELGWQHEA